VYALHGSASILLFLGNKSLSGGSVMVPKSALILCALALSVATTAFAQTDSTLSANVKTRLAADETVKGSSMKVATDDHVVTLSGTVPSQAVRDRALHIARDTAGVTSVVDKLTIGEAAGKTTAQKAAGGVEKGVDKSADAVGTAAHKSAGAVDKSKEKVGDAAEKTGEAIGTAAKATGKAVETAGEKTKETTTAAGKKTGEVVTDASITTAVKTKLLGDGETPGLKINVDTEDGVVTLHGDVANAEARAEAVRLARTTKGVKRVVDKLTVGGK